MLRGIITQRYRSFTVKSVFSDREPELWLRVTPVAYRSFLIPTGLKFQSALAKTTRALIWNRNRVTRILVNILTTRILSVSSPQYVIYVDFNGVGPFTSWCCQSLAIMHVLLDGHERERDVIVFSGRGSDLVVGEVSDDVWQVRQSEGVCYGPKYSPIVFFLSHWTHVISLLKK